MSAKKIIAMFIFIFVTFQVNSETTTKFQSASDCLKCHEKQIASHDYFNSSHKDLSCTACHVKDENLNFRSQKNTCISTYKKMDCAKCHAKVVNEYLSSVHNGNRLPINCTKCHSEIHAIQSHKNDKIAIAQKCGECHSKQGDYFNSQHYTALKEGHNDSATCTDCHGLHAIMPIDNVSKGRIFHTKACLQCHDDKEKMKKNNVNTIAGETFYNSFHGKNVRLGYPEKVAGCADCHSAHSVLKANNPKSTINKANLVNTCSQCHSNATISFVKYNPHAEDHDRKNFTALYWTRIAMTGLLIGTFLFFWIHSMLWALRSFIEKQKNKNDLLKEANLLSNLKKSDGHKIYRRFKTEDILLHIIVVVSFLGLSITGLPLKFNATNWGKVLMDLIGGTERARLIHHFCAVVTFVYFMIAIIKSLKFLFINKKIKGSFLEKLLGPDSLFPNARDISDVQNMFKWFLFVGEKPRFERWTYWEKFDFMAVFWGMFVIGSSGLMLWFPEFFGKLMPGWMFNIATIVHSDEALLATGFIFTVHFFNTHLRPEKFPMDFVIFNGQITKREMLEERADQLKRYETENRLEEFEVKKPSSILWNLVLRLFGYAAVLIGISLFIGIISAMLMNS